MDDQRQQIIDRLGKANNVLVTVSNNPSVDQLSACIGLTLALNKLDKHATAVFSGQVPSTIEFLQPDETLEKNTDSLRDFIISLDKSKADKLRYKVEDRVVRIFITPYRTSITDQDLEFSQGDFNVDVVLAIGVQTQQDLDQAITAHGRILHDATVVTVNNVITSELGSINWLATATSSLSEMATMLVEGLGKDLFDQQISTALLTGIVAETDRFSNEKTSAETMNASAALMAAGANQQLVATKLQEPVKEPEVAPLSEEMPEKQAEPEEPKLSEVQISNDGTLQIDHADANGDTEPKDEAKEKADEPAGDTPKLEEQSEQEGPQPKSNESPKPATDNTEGYDNPRKRAETPDAANMPPPFTSAMAPAAEEAPLTTALDLPPVAPLAAAPAIAPLVPPTPPVPSPPPTTGNETLQDIEQHVHSSHLTPPAQQAVVDTSNNDGSEDEELDLSKLERPEGVDDGPEEKSDLNVDAARDAVAQAMAGDSSTSPEPIAALNAQPLAENINSNPPAAAAASPEPEPLSPLIQPDPAGISAADQAMTMPLPPVPTAVPAAPPAQPPTKDDPNAPPPVPPPIIPFSPQ